ncbi:glycosyltransferase [Simiduia sp. 21SJ11W-1]|uniref:glycosyltransferase n=1 Tax=Simiduia sp. 21SJ11W-1 TaxID=2909669 RepID=UPI00209D4B87|nr:glycosyltransferase [Simiduia sp. 21SJ11W-1]UTA48004.1 glycosyltransferase [Simiduia sp. 21SJ11W-1]
MKVAQILAGAPQGGAENMYVRLVKGLHAQGELQTKAFLRDHQHRLDDLRAAGVEAEGFRFGSALHFLDHLRYVRALKSFSPDLVMTWMNRASGATPKGDYVLVSRLGHYYDLKYYRHCDYWVGISKGICNHLIQGGMPAAKVFHIPNFADETPVQPLPRDSYNTPTDKPLILAAGRLHVNKAFDTLLHALAKVPEATLWLAGSGPEEANLKALASELGLAERVRFLGWRTDVTALMRTADVFVCPSRYEGLGSIVMESWAHQCPIIATNSEGPGEVITHGETGLVTPVDEVAPLADAINQLLNNPAQRQVLTERAYAHYQKVYAREVIVQQYLDLYKQLVPNSV